MSLLAGLASDESIVDESDVLGGGAFQPLATDIYGFKVKMAYLDKKPTGSLFVNFTFESEDGQEMRENFCVQSGNAKGNKNYYIDRKDQKQYLPGYNIVNSISLLTIGKHLNKLTPEKKTIKIYDYEAQGDVPTEVEVLTELLEQDFYGAVFNQVEDKTKLNDATNKYEPTGETRVVNELNKVFRYKDKLTTSEVRAKATEPQFYTDWETKWKGSVRDKSTNQAGSSISNGNISTGSKPEEATNSDDNLFS